MTPEIKIFSDGDVVEALDYLSYRDSQPEATMDEVADHFDISRATLYRRINKWTKSGVLERARQAILVPKAEAILAANIAAVEAWPKIVAKMVNDALNADKAVIRHSAAKWLYDEIIKPTTEAMPDAASEELAYVTQEQDFLPTVIEAQPLAQDTNPPNIPD